MLKAVEKNDKAFRDFCDRDVFGTRIKAYYNCYSTDFDFMKFWAQYDDSGKITAAISRIDGDATLCVENADFEELSEFLRVIGYSDIICAECAAEKLGLDVSDSSYIVEYRNPVTADNTGILNDFDKREIYSLLCECGFSMGDYGSFLADICARLNKNTASVAAIAENGELCSCAFSLFNGRKSALLGAVATRESARGRGCAGKLVTCLANSRGKKTFLFCRNDGLSEFYKKHGFEICGRWAVIK